MAEQVLQTFNSLIETPYVSATFGGKTFGLTNTVNPVTKTRDINFIKSLTVAKKASGTVNQYTLNMDYVIKPGHDPNYIDKIISSDISRKIFFSYGDLSQPQYTYKQEQAIITSITPNIDMRGQKISYQVKATSSVSLSYSIKRNFPARTAKPSDIIWDLLYHNSECGLLQLFTGMADESKVALNGWIARNDKAIQIEAKQGISPLEYLRFLVSQMASSTGGTFYAMVIHDRVDVFEGPWFEVVYSGYKAAKYLLEIDVGYPGSIPVFNFTVSNNTSFALITKFEGEVDKDRVININRFGEAERSSDPSFIISNGSRNSVLASWWNSMTSFPVNGQLTTRGLIVPAILCEVIKINCLFFGRKYNYSGEYMVVGQTDTIAATGYRSQLDLIRTKGEEI